MIYAVRCFRLTVRLNSTMINHLDKSLRKSYIVNIFVIITEVAIILIKDLSIQILELLEDRKEMRNSEIVKALWKKQSRDPSGLFKVKVTRTLTKLAKDKLVEKITRSHKNVAYVIIEQGRNWIGTFYLNEMIASMPPVEFKVFQTLMYFLISHVYIMAPPKVTVEDYRKMLVEQLNKADFIDKAKALMNDRRKVYEQFSEHLKRYRAKRLSTLKKDSNVFSVSK